MTSGTFYGPDEFTDQEIEFAISLGAIIKKQFSKTEQMEYFANTCGACGNFCGKFFVHHYLDLVEGIELPLRKD